MPATTAIRPATSLLLAIMLCLLTTTAAGQTFGPHAGISVHSEQFYFGIHAETPPVADRLRFRPSIDLGLGDDRTTAAFNVEFAYHFTSAQPWRAYTGGGPALNIIKSDSETYPGAGFNILLGVAHEDGLFAEVKAGAFESPRLRLGVGYQLRFP